MPDRKKMAEEQVQTGQQRAEPEGDGQVHGQKQHGKSSKVQSQIHGVRVLRGLAHASAGKAGEQPPWRGYWMRSEAEEGRIQRQSRRDSKSPRHK